MQTVRTRKDNQVQGLSSAVSQRGSSSHSQIGTGSIVYLPKYHAYPIVCANYHMTMRDCTHGNVSMSAYSPPLYALCISNPSFCGRPHAFVTYLSKANFPGLIGGDSTNQPLAMRIQEMLS